MLLYCRSTSLPFSSPIYPSPLNFLSVDLLHFTLSSPNLRENSHLKRKKKGYLSISLQLQTHRPLFPLSSSLKTPLKSSTSILSARPFDFPQNPSPTPIYNDSDSKSKPRKQLIKKNTTAEESTPDFGIREEDDGEELGDFVRGESDYDDSRDGKRKKFEKDGIGSSRKREKKSKSKSEGRDGLKLKLKKAGDSFEPSRHKNGEAEVKEM